MFGRDKQDDMTQVADDNGQQTTNPPVFVPEPEHLDADETSMQESVDAVMSQDQPEETHEAEQTSASSPEVATNNSEPNFIMTSAPAAPEDDSTDGQSSSPAESEEAADAKFTVPVTVNGSRSDQNSYDLAAIKNEALKSLAPLVDHLDQSPEEKYKTVMMMLEASQDPSLVQVAYEAAKNIPDDEAKSKALLEIVAKIDSLGN